MLRVAKAVNINGVDLEVSEGTIVFVDDNGHIVTRKKAEFLAEEPKQVELLLPSFTDAVEEEEDEEIELIQCNFLAERWLIDFFSKEYKKAKQQSTSKLLKREFVGQLIAGKFQDEHPSE